MSSLANLIQRIYVDEGHPDPLPDALGIAVQLALERQVPLKPPNTPVWVCIGQKRLRGRFHRADYERQGVRALMLATSALTKAFGVRELVEDLREFGQADVADEVDPFVPK